jgi:hypothetical protein
MTFEVSNGERKRSNNNGFEVIAQNQSLEVIILCMMIDCWQKNHP